MRPWKWFQGSSRTELDSKEARYRRASTTPYRCACETTISVYFTRQGELRPVCYLPGLIMTRDKPQRPWLLSIGRPTAYHLVVQISIYRDRQRMPRLDYVPPLLTFDSHSRKTTLYRTPCSHVVSSDGAAPYRVLWKRDHPAGRAKAGLNSEKLTRPRVIKDDLALYSQSS